MKTYNRIRTAAVAVGGLFGLATGLGAYTLIYARGGSYLTNNPKACANCHIMQGHFDAWVKSSHRSVATCNDCHTPHTFVGKYWTKTEHGLMHSYAFTTGRFHEPISMKARSRTVTEGACRHCHAEITHAIDPRRGEERDQISCIRCHGDVGHLQ